MNTVPNIFPTPGIHYGVPANVYHSWQALSHSWLNKLRQTPAHLLDLIEHGGDEPTADMIFGSAVHSRVLEPDEYPHRYAVREEGVSGTTKAGKEFKEKHESMGLIVLANRDGRWVEAVARRALDNPRLQEWLHRNHQVEVSLVWERDGYLCKARPDLLVPGLNVIADLKTTKSASEKGFAAQTAKLNYHGQAAWYLEGIQKLTGQAWDWQFIVCEKRRPFLVNCHGMPRDSAAHLLAVAEIETLFEQYKACMKSRRWPGYPDVPEIHLPEWALEASAIEEESFDE